MTIILFILIILLDSILQTSTGFGFPIMTTPFLLLLFEPKESIQINLLLSVVISFALIRKIRRDVEVGILIRFIIESHDWHYYLNINGTFSIWFSARELES